MIKASNVTGLSIDIINNRPKKLHGYITNANSKHIEK